MNPALLRNIHLEALQRTFALPDTAMGAIELVLDIALNQQHCEEMTDLVKLKDYMVEKKPHLKAPFSPAAEALRYILQLEAMNAKLAEEHSEACQELATAKEEITRLGTPSTSPRSTSWHGTPAHAGSGRTQQTPPEGH